MRLPRIAKAMAITALTWGAVWASLSIPTLYWLIRHPSPLTAGEHLQLWSTSVLLPAVSQGMLMGAGFAALMILLGKRAKSFEGLSYLKVGATGAVAAFVMSIIGALIGLPLVTGIQIALIGGLTSTATLAIARRAPLTKLETTGEQLHLR